MRPFKQHFLASWNENVIEPLQRDLKVDLGDYASLLQGQLTLAVVQNGSRGPGEPPLGLLLLLDTKDKSNQLKTNLVELRKRWVDAGRSLRTQKIRDVDFAVISMSSKDIPGALRPLFPKLLESPDTVDNPESKASEKKRELIVGQLGSLLIAGNSQKGIEKIVARLTGGSLPALADSAAFQANTARLFRDAPVYAWVNVKAFVDLLLRQDQPPQETAEAPNPFEIKPEKLVNALGLAGLRTVAASFRNSNSGEQFEFFLGAPANERRGLLKLLAGEPKEINPPPFVPAEAVKFHRWRIDGQKAWATFEKMLGEISPAWLGGLNSFLQAANAAGRERDPGFDVRQNLIGNLGDDVILYQKASRNAAGQSGPQLVLVGSPNADQLAASLKTVLVFFGQQPGTQPDQREFLGRKVYTVSIGNLALPLGGGASSPGPRTLHYAASGGYLALSSEVSLLEEYLRHADTQSKRLRDAPGLNDAIQKVAGQGACWFGYENDLETMRATLEALRKTAPVTFSNAAPSASAGIEPFTPPSAGKGVQDWLDFSLLPPFEKISKYFSFSVYGGSVNADGLTIRLFNTAPPALKSGAAR